MDLVFKNKHDFAMSFEKHKAYLGGEVTKRIQEAKFEGYRPTKLRKGDEKIEINGFSIFGRNFKPFLNFL